LNSTDETAIREQLRAMTSAWERGDAVAYAAACTDDARYVTASGTRLFGRADIARAHQAVFDGPMRGTTLDLDENIDLHVIGQGVVMVQATGAVRFPPHDGSGVRGAGVLSLLAVGHDGHWRFASFTNVPITPESQL